MQGAFFDSQSDVSAYVTIGKIENIGILCVFFHLFIAYSEFLNYIALGSNQFSLMETDGKFWRMKVLTYDSNESNHVRRSVLMKNTSIFALAAGMGSMILASSASADVAASMVSMGDNAQGHTYRLYITGLADGDRIDAVYGNAGSVLDISGNFYENAFGGSTSMDINPALLAVFPSLANDSWVTIGLTDNVGNALNNIGMNFDAGSYNTDNGSWFVTPDDAQGEAVDGSVLIGQFTVVGGTGVVSDDFSSAVVNVQGTIGGAVVQHEGLNAIPAPGALALLGVAGLAARRRRK